MGDAAGTPPTGRIFPELSNVELAERLKTRRCTGLLWLATVDCLVGYGRATLHRQIGDGTVNAKTRQLRRPVELTEAEREYLREHPEKRDDLVNEAAATGLRLFRDRGILGGEWDPERGADVKTYFVNGCLLGLATPVDTWRRTRSRSVPTISYDPTLPSVLAALAALDGDPTVPPASDADLDAILAAWPADLAAVARTVAVDDVSWRSACRRHHVDPRRLERHLAAYRRSHPEREEPS